MFLGAAEVFFGAAEFFLRHGETLLGDAKTFVDAAQLFRRAAKELSTAAYDFRIDAQSLGAAADTMLHALTRPGAGHTHEPQLPRFREALRRELSLYRNNGVVPPTLVPRRAYAPGSRGG